MADDLRKASLRTALAHGPTFLDVEASSLTAVSWPVEIGIARVAGGVVTGDARLIRPSPDWPRDDWSQESAEIYGIALDRLCGEGHDPADVARWLIGAVPGGAVSDAPAFDASWIDRLFEVVELRWRWVRWLGPPVRWG